MPSQSMRKRSLAGASALLTVVFLLVGMAAADPGPRLIPFQGRLTDGAGQALSDGNYRLVFAIYDEPTNGTTLWTEVHAAASVGSAAAHSNRKPRV